MKIKNLIEYYYHIKIEDLYKKKRQYKFNYQNNEYLFLPLTRYEREIIEINNLIKNNYDYDQFIFNIENKIVTRVNNQNYILIKKSLKSIKISSALQAPFYVSVPKEFFKNIDRSNWVFLWSEKIDYIEYQQQHLDSQYPLLRNSLNYFIGMGENAISYVFNTYHSLTSENNNLVISHKRIRNKDFNNPLNLIVDYKSRDVAEYLKYLFFNNDYDYIKIKQMIINLNFDQFSYQLIYGRMLFPTYYFDMYDEIINKKKDEKEILHILKRVEEYEDYITNIYLIINQIFTIEKVDWL